ncbi:group III truncated hemoglobin [Membranicola marinus]|uniref:Group III truncated hemoglobin n=1 Tax=Membranihabitans marinus TaxID=1227546 RepID=A0A953L8W7_9BACT|nr:group III truncated hemoglobin [Membranihabitans marinus]MBY5956998.1 group III truncated hemoglobin [Membranihabitans marinus]
MQEIKKIETLEDIKLLVDEFYGRIRQDELLADIFNGVIEDQWPAHLEKMYTFWQTVLLKEHTYYGSPFTPHATLPVEKQHFERWLKLFHETLDAHFHGEKADEAKWRAERMAEMFLYKIKYYQENHSKPLL